MREKLAEYADDGAEWPLTACILDPVRASVSCPGPAQILEVGIFACPDICPLLKCFKFLHCNNFFE